jgi:hypothetical protein
MFCFNLKTSIPFHNVDRRSEAKTMSALEPCSDNRKDLLEVSTKDNGDSTKWTVWGVEKVTACAVHSFGSILDVAS